MLENVQKIWQRFLYRDSILLEAERQKNDFGRMDDWAVQFSQLIEDVVFQTFVQVNIFLLHRCFIFKLISIFHVCMYMYMMINSFIYSLLLLIFI